MKHKFQILLTVAYLLILSSVQAQYRTERIKRDFEIRGNGVFYLDIEIDAGEVYVMRNTDENKIAVSMRYDENEYEHNFDFSEKNRHLTISFDKKGWVDHDDHNGDAEIEISLPIQVKLDIKSKIKAGQIEMILGGLALNEFYLKTWAGEVLVDFDKPNRIEMKNLDINIKVGETRLRSLGNARFRIADIDNGIGALEIDFFGDLPDDAIATIDLDIGETDISIPDDLGVKLEVKKFLFLSQVNISRKFRKSGGYYFSDNYDAKNKAFDLEVRPGIGELNVRYR